MEEYGHDMRPITEEMAAEFPLLGRLYRLAEIAKSRPAPTIHVLYDSALVEQNSHPKPAAPETFIWGQLVLKVRVE